MDGADLVTITEPFPQEQPRAMHSNLHIGNADVQGVGYLTGRPVLLRQME